MHLVVGATGLLGLEICRQLAAAGKPVKALVRPTSDQARVEELRHLGATLVQGDLKDRSSLDAACRGVAAVLSTASATFEGLLIALTPAQEHLGDVGLHGRRASGGMARSRSKEHKDWPDVY